MSPLDNIKQILTILNSELAEGANNSNTLSRLEQLPLDTFNQLTADEIRDISKQVNAIKTMNSPEEISPKILNVLKKIEKIALNILIEKE